MVVDDDWMVLVGKDVGVAERNATVAVDVVYRSAVDDG